MADFYLRTRCRMCDSADLEMVMALTPTPPGNNFLRHEELALPEPSYPLDLYFCRRCHHVQLGHVVDPKILYQKDYFYVSGTSSRFVEHLRDYALDMVRRFDLSPGDFVADIGSNDGTCLRCFQEAGTKKVLGVDPATKIARRATESGIETVGDFFSYDLALALREKYGPATFITSHNACAHIDNLADVVRGVRHWLTDDGLFVLEVGYLLDVYENVWFDTIYHEHLDFHTVAPFKELFARTGMEMIGVQRVSPQGGSIRVMAQKAGGPRAADGSVEALIEQEHAAGLNKPETFVRFGQRVNEVGTRLRSLVKSLTANGKTIAGYGAATKSTTLLAHFGLGSDDLAFIVDDNPLKQGLFSPAAHIPVVAVEELHHRQVDYLLILAWNFAEPIMENNRWYEDQGGKFIVPMPVPRIVER
ncbi:MAG: class I SAM-dependent methyltransferase [Gemmatimonadota bacterium]|nr:class I SAM-dependent methyltransferase [Gemmatimonadota bacterium]